MLVLSRKQGQSIRIADEITITVVDLGRGRVRLGITAPRSVPVHREELASATPDRRTKSPPVVELSATVSV